MIDGLNIKKDPESEKILKEISDTEQKILDSVILNDEYYLKVTGNLNPTPAIVSKLPDVASQGFLLIYNQLQELLGKDTQMTKDTSPVSKGLGAIFARVGIGMQELGKGFEFLGVGLTSMGSFSALAGLGVATLALGAIGAFIAGLSWLETKGTGIGELIRGIFIGIADGVLYFISGLSGIMHENLDVVELVLDTVIEGLQALGPVVQEVAPILTSGFDNISSVINTFILNLDEIVTSVGNFATDFMVKMMDGVTTSIERLAKVDGKALFTVAGGVTALAVALALYATGNTFAGISQFFASDKIVTVLERFATVGPNLALAGSGLKELGMGFDDLYKARLPGSGFSAKDGEELREFVISFNDYEFKNALKGMASVLPTFNLFSESMNTLATGVEAISEIKPSDWTKSMKRLRELLGLGSKMNEGFANFQDTVGGMLGLEAKDVQDAVFSLESSDNSGSYFQTKDGLIKTNPADNLSIVASTNKPTDNNNEFTEMLAEKMDVLLRKLDSYIETIATKEPDVTVIPSSGGQRSTQMDELLRVGV